jgi:hypothetical protein
MTNCYKLLIRVELDTFYPNLIPIYFRTQTYACYTYEMSRSYYISNINYFRYIKCMKSGICMFHYASGQWLFLIQSSNILCSYINWGKYKNLFCCLTVFPTQIHIYQLFSSIILYFN